jgi:hypothetical protein
MRGRCHEAISGERFLDVKSNEGVSQEDAETDLEQKIAEIPKRMQSVCGNVENSWCRARLSFGAMGEEWKDGRVEGGRMEDWKDGRVEYWGNGVLGKWDNGAM